MYWHGWNLIWYHVNDDHTDTTLKNNTYVKECTSKCERFHKNIIICSTYRQFTVTETITINQNHITIYFLVILIKYIIRITTNISPTLRIGISKSRIRQQSGYDRMIIRLVLGLAESLPVLNPRMSYYIH